MATIRRLDVALTLSSAAFSRGLASARTSLNSFQAAITSTKGMLVGLAGAAGIGLSIHALKNMVDSASETIDTTSKLSDRLGSTTEEIVGLQHAAGQAGVEFEGLNKSLDIMLRNIGKAAGGDKSAGLFKSLGLDPKGMAAQGAVQSFAQIADAINKLPNPAARMAAVTGIFGKSGATLLPMIQAGSAGLKEMTRDAEALGLSFSNIDAKEVEAANDALSRLGSVFKGVANTVAIELAPIIKHVADNLTEMKTAGAGAGNAIRNAITGAAKAVGVFQDAWQAVKIGWLGVQVAFLTGLALIADGISQVLTQFDKLIAGADRLAANIMRGDVLNIGDGIAEAMEKVQDRNGFMKAWRDELAKAAIAAKKEMDKLIIEPSAVTKIENALEDIRRKSHAQAAKEYADALKQQFAEAPIIPKFMNRDPSIKRAGISEEGSAEAFRNILAAQDVAGGRKTEKDLQREQLTEQRKANALLKEQRDALKIIEKQRPVMGAAIP